MSEVPPALIAEYDQAYAAAGTLLDGLVRGHQQNVKLTEQWAAPSSAAVYALTFYLVNELEPEAVTSALAVAVDRISRALEAAEQ